MTFGKARQLLWWSVLGRSQDFLELTRRRQTRIAMLVTSSFLLIRYVVSSVDEQVRRPGSPYAYFTSRWRPLSVWIFPRQALVWNQGLPDSCGEIPCRVFQRAMTSLVGTTGSIGTNSDYLEHYCTTEGRLPRISFSDSLSRFPIYLNHPKSQPTARPWRCREIALVRAGDAV